MPTSPFKSTTNRAGSSSTSDCSTSRTLTRPTPPDPNVEAGYNSNVPRGKFVNTTRGSGGSFPEIILPHLPLDFFSSSSTDDNDSDRGVVEPKERPGRSVSRLAQVGRLPNDTASSKRRARSVSKSRGGGRVVSSTSISGGKTAISKEAGSRRRRSLSVARYQISDSESEVDNFQKSSKQAAAKAPTSWDFQNSSGQKTTPSSNRRLGRSRSHKNLSILHDGYCSEHPTPDVATGGLYEAMRKEIRYAVEEIRTELNQTMGKNQTDIASCDYLKSKNNETLWDFSGIKEKHASKVKELEKCKRDCSTEMLHDEQGQRVSEIYDGFANLRTSVVSDKPPQDRKRSTDRNRISENLIEEAEHIFEDFICNVEGADTSSFGGERSDGSSTIGGSMKSRDSATREMETHETTAEMDGVILPWLQWETSDESILFQWDSVKDMALPHDPSMHSLSSHGSWSPGIFPNPHITTREEDAHVLKDSISSFDMDEYLKLQNNEDLLFETYREQNRINSGGMLLCTGVLY